MIIRGQYKGDLSTSYTIYNVLAQMFFWIFIADIDEIALFNVCFFVFHIDYQSRNSSICI